MKKLANLAAELSEKEIIQHLEAADVKGGRRIVTNLKYVADYVLSYLKSIGYNPHTAQHDDQYCIEW